MQVFGPVFMTPQQTLQVHAPPPPSLATYWPPAATMAAIQSRHELEHNLSMQEFAIARYSIPAAHDA
jgi:hypothetical protein